jgi:nicotinamidase/pyrazinamidase
MLAYGPTTALVVVDIQNDFADPAGSLYVGEGEQVVPVVNAEIRAARDAGALVVYTQDWHPEHTPHFAQDGGIWPVHCVHDTWGAAFRPDLDVDGPVVQKGWDGRDGYSAFSVRDPESGETYPTVLEHVLRDRGVESIIVCGLATDYCVVETTRDARSIGFPTTVIADAIRPVDRIRGDGERALQRMRSAGATVV